MVLNYDKSKWIYEADDSKNIRYVLGTKGSKTLICFGVNPSTATPENLDNTLKSVVRITNHNKYDSWIMLNLYPQRNRYIDDIDKICNDEIHKKNLNFIKRVLNSGHCDIWAAWGTLIERRDYLNSCLVDIYKEIKPYNCNWYRAGKLTKYGHPHHPLFLPAASPKVRFDIKSYVKNLRSN